MKTRFTSYLLLAVFLAIALTPANAAVLKGPYLIYEGINTEMTVLWQLDSTQQCTIEWGEPPRMAKAM